jgi:hypothetical protein
MLKKTEDTFLQFLLFVLLVGALTGCAGAISTSPGSTRDTEIIPSPSASPAATSQPGSGVERTPLLTLPSPRQPGTLPPGLEPVPPTGGSPLVGEVPEGILDEIFADLLKRTGAAREDINILRAESVLWNDGSLGCPKPGEFYIQMLINGYWVVLEVGDQEYDYRVSGSGAFSICEGESMPSLDTGEKPQNPLVSQAKEDLAGRLGVPISAIELLNIEEVTWRDSSMGCPQPGMAYTQVLVNGSLIQLQHKETAYQYHSGRGRTPFLCENPPKNLDEVIIHE